jgi:hypothetical protein
MEGFMMQNNYPTESVTYEACGACGHTSFADDKFCRRCGAKQDVQTNSPTRDVQSDRLGFIKEADSERERPASSYATAPLAQMGDALSRYRPVSGSLVNALINGMADVPAARACSPLMRRAIFALSMIPIWLIIIFLSPLDAYLAARSAADSNDCGHPKPGQRLGALFRRA